MSLDKAIKSGKEHRKEYIKAKAVDRSCRNNGSCEWCKSNRLHNNMIKEQQYSLKNYRGDCNEN